MNESRLPRAMAARQHGLHSFLKDADKKSQNRRSFPFNIAKLTKTKPSERRRSAPKTNLAKAKSCGDLENTREDTHEETREDTRVEVHEQRPRKLSQDEERQKNNSEDISGHEGTKIVDTKLSELSAELSAALATPAPKLIEINLSRDYLMGNDDVSSLHRRRSSEIEKGITHHTCFHILQRTFCKFVPSLLTESSSERRLFERHHDL